MIGFQAGWINDNESLQKELTLQPSQNRSIGSFFRSIWTQFISGSLILGPAERAFIGCCYKALIWLLVRWSEMYRRRASLSAPSESSTIERTSTPFCRPTYKYVDATDADDDVPPLLSN
jgi:hypothetical protein